MKKTLLMLALVILHFASIAQISPVYTYHFQHVLDSVCKKNKIKGISAAIYRPNEGIWTGVYGESEDGVAITPDMYFPIGSNTKTFTAAAMLKLQETGLLDLDDTIGKWITHPNVNGQITIRQMLNHTSGLNNYTDNQDFSDSLNKDFNRVWQPEELYQFIDTPLNEPGAVWNYSNTNYLLAGIIISKVTGKPAHIALRDMILTPQNLSHTYFYPHEQPNGTIPHGWSQMQMNKPIEDLQVNYGFSNIAFLSMATTAGAYVSTAEDNVKFWNQLMSGSILNNNSMHELKDTVDIGSGVGYGLGIFKFGNFDGHVAYNHGGTCFGYLNENLYDSVTGVSITVLSNQDSIDNDMLLMRVVRALHKVTLTMPPTGINDHTSQVDIQVYPNPVANNLIISLDNYKNDATLAIYDITGRIILNENISGAKNTISLSGITTGTYLLKINAHDGIQLHTQRLQVIK